MIGFDIRSAAKAVAAALCLGLAAGPAIGDTTSLSPNEAFTLALSELRAGNAPLAVQIADALLVRNPNDANALLLRTDAALVMGAYEDAVAFGKRAYYAATSRANKLQAARLTALGLTRLERYTRAQIWLRTASDYADTQAAWNVLTRDYRQVQSVNPLSVSLRFGITPNNNVNNGSSGSSFAFGQFLANQGLNFPTDIFVDIEGDTKQLSGYQFSLGSDLQYRLSKSETASNFITASFDFSTYTLSKAAKAIAPDANGRDYENGTLKIGFARQQLFDGQSDPMLLRFEMGQTWFDQKPYTRFTEASFSQSYRIDPRNSFTVSGYIKDQNILSSDVDTRTVGVRLGWAHLFENKDRLQVSIHGSKSQSDRIDSTADVQELSVGYQWNKPFAGMKFGAGLSLGQSYQPQSVYAAEKGPRSAVTYGVNASVQFTEIEYYGFQPVVTIRGSVTESTEDLFDRENLSVGFDLRSSF